MLKNEYVFTRIYYLLAKIGVDTAENGPSKVWCELAAAAVVVPDSRFHGLKSSDVSRARPEYRARPSTRPVRRRIRSRAAKLWRNSPPISRRTQAMFILTLT